MINTILSLRRMAKEMITNPQTGRVSHTKLAASTAYFVGTVCFVWFHCWLFNPKTELAKVQAGLGQMAILWGVYFTVIAGHQTASKWVSGKLGTNKQESKTE